MPVIRLCPLLLLAVTAGCTSDPSVAETVDAGRQDMSDMRGRNGGDAPAVDVADAPAREAAGALGPEVSDVAGPELGPGGCLPSAPPSLDDGCGMPARPDCPRPCGPELDVMCCRGGDRCVERTADGCAYIRTCTSWTDGPCALHGGPAVRFCGSPITQGYAMRWDRGAAIGWSCTTDGQSCGGIARCTQGRWQAGL